MKTHEPDWTSLVAGLTFCGIAIAYLAADIADRSLELRWVVPILLIGLGMAGLAGTIVHARRSPIAPPIATAAPYATDTTTREPATDTTTREPVAARGVDTPADADLDGPDVRADGGDAPQN
jgi:hypothetical protein